jgi:hypothetical protein
MMDSMQRSLYLNGEVARAGKMEAEYEKLMAKLEKRFE